MIWPLMGSIATNRLSSLDKPEVVKESYVIDYTSPTFQTLVMEEEGGFNYKWVYGPRHRPNHTPCS